MKTKSEESISRLLIDGQIIASAKVIYTYLNNFFTSVAVKINKNIVNTKNIENSNTIFLSPTIPEETEDLISSMKSNKASGQNSIPTKILKLFKKGFSKPLNPHSQKE